MLQFVIIQSATVQQWWSSGPLTCASCFHSSSCLWAWESWRFVILPATRHDCKSYLYMPGKVHSILTHASTILCMVLCTGKEEGEETPEAWDKSYRAAEGKKGRQACSFRANNKRGTSTHRVGLFFHMHLVMIWHKKTIYPSNKHRGLCMRIFDVYMGWTKCMGDLHNI